MFKIHREDETAVERGIGGDDRTSVPESSFLLLLLLLFLKTTTTTTASTATTTAHQNAMAYDPNMQIMEKPTQMPM